MENWSAHQLYNKAKIELDSASASKLRFYAQNLQRSNLPVIFTLKHLAEITSVDFSLLHSTVTRKREAANYRMFAITKRSGGLRHIHAVSADLLKVQQFINAEILQKIAPHTASFAFHPSGGIRACAAKHCEARWIFQFDLTNFFYTINERDVYNVFKEIGYRPLLAFELARICTTLRLPSHLRKYIASSYKFNSRNNYRFYQAYSIGVLPQGAPTSPMLGNLVARKLDESLTHYADEHGLVYTRYADDLTFSTSENYPRGQSIKKIQRSIINIIHQHNFYENKGKTRVSGPGARKRVLGLLVDGDKPRLSKETYNRIDRHLHASNKYGIMNVAKHEGFDSAFGFYNHLVGLLAFIKDVDLSKWKKLHAQFSTIDIDF